MPKNLSGTRFFSSPPPSVCWDATGSTLVGLDAVALQTVRSSLRPIVPRPTPPWPASAAAPAAVPFRGPWPSTTPPAYARRRPRRPRPSTTPESPAKAEDWRRSSPAADRSVDARWRSTARRDSSSGESSGKCAAGRSPIFRSQSAAACLAQLAFACSFQYVHRIFHGAIQRHFQPQQLPGVRGAKIDRRLRALWNRVHAGAAADRPQVQRGARLFWQLVSASVASAVASAAIGLACPRR